MKNVITLLFKATIFRKYKLFFKKALQHPQPYNIVGEKDFFEIHPNCCILDYFFIKIVLVTVLT